MQLGGREWIQADSSVASGEVCDVSFSPWFLGHSDDLRNSFFKSLQQFISSIDHISTRCGALVRTDTYL